jgi:hypothetical protein
MEIVTHCSKRINLRQNEDFISMYYDITKSAAFPGAIICSASGRPEMADLGCHSGAESVTARIQVLLRSVALACGAVEPMPRSGHLG